MWYTEQTDIQTSKYQISRTFEAARYGFEIVGSLWNLTGRAAETPAQLQSNFQHQILRLISFMLDLLVERPSALWIEAQLYE